MKPDLADAVLDNVVRSLASWIAELEEIEGRCPACPHKVNHLLSSMRQGHTSLVQMIARNKPSPP